MRGRTNARLTAGLVTLALCCSELASYIPAQAVGSEDEYSVDHEIVTSWDGGYQADLTLNNLSDKDMTDWEVSFTIPAEITDSWGGAFVLSDSVEYEDENEESVNNTYVVTAGDYNAAIPAGGSITVGYVANGETGDVTDIEVDYTLVFDDTNDSENDEDDDENESDENDESTQAEPSGTIYAGNGYTVEVQIPQSWEHAYNAKLIITNTSDETLHNWGFLLKTDDDISGLYNAIELYDHGGMRLFKNAGYNQDITAGGTVEVGYTAYYGDSFDVPDEFALASFERSVEMPEYRIETFVTDEWDEGALAEIVIENISDKAIEDWKLEFDSDMNISRVWDGVLVSHDGDHYIIRNADYAQNIAAGDSWTVGLEINGSISDIENVIMTEIAVTDEVQLSDEPTVSENTVSENTVSENTVSENIVEPEIYDGKYVIIDTTEYGEAAGLPLVDEYIEQIGGFLVDSENIFSVSYEVYDSFGERVKNGVLDINDDKWQASGIGLGIGCNKIVFKIILKNGTEIEEANELINISLDNLLNADIDLDDTDGDHILNYFEKYYNTNKTLADTDEDGLLDGEEVYYADSDPSVYDSLSKGTADGEIDLDGDGLTNKEEVQIGTSPLNADSDDDGLSDGFEAHTSYTNPTEYDTDGDGYSDGEELNLGLDPLSSDSDNNGIPDGSEIIKQHVTQNYDDQVIKEATVDISCAGSIKEKVFVSSKYDPDSVACDVVGLIGMPVNVNCHTDFETAEITFRYDETMLGDTKETDLCLMWYDEDNCEFVLLEDSVVDVTNNTVKYTTTHFSTYMLVDREKWKTRYPIDYTVSDYSINENYDFIVFIDYTVSPQDLLREQAIAANIVDKMEEGDRLLFLYLRSNSVYQKQINGGLNWSTTKQQALSNIDPNDAWSIWGSGVSLSPTGLYNGCAEQSLKAVTYIGNTVNKQIIYLIYPGDRYDTRFSENYSLMNDNAQIAKANGCVFNAVSLTDNVSATLTQYTLMMNGVQYMGTDEQIDSAIFADLSSRLSIGDTFIDTTDSDGDGLYDVCETKGMVGTNGCVYYSDPNIVDSDGDGFADGEEVGDMDPETGYFGVVSDPMNADSIKRGGDYYDPVYIIGWSYSGGRDCKPFEHNWNAAVVSATSDMILNVDGDTSDWNELVWEEFTRTNLFSQAAETKKRELICRGINENQIVYVRIDDGEQFQNLWNEWSEYKCIQELHIYSHGVPGKPEVCGGTIGKFKEYPKLEYSAYGRVFFYGCHVAVGNDMQVFANSQDVAVYASLYTATFSSDENCRVPVLVYVDPLSMGRGHYSGDIGDVYLYSYADMSVGVPARDLVFYGYDDWEIGVLRYTEFITPFRPLRIQMKKFEPEK